ncbi:phosphate ABC transporter substrate-binding protein PstS [Aestuariimicrobium sp. T2.26MG-19.2B]|uniref:phosphate ABC transporter substrate-binding protein PstS n=1 Tax=Aestuariimicrobium sp. T2.26MG-19.2B TaxID=3040679 RepID=UPI002477BB93|nr:phosphate ABC transporter substrate-binding protein PstS [Aestuariimicrobium sp. T2.26MG-19.2B]CAI9405345.1 Phosphate-binding protein PstS 3 [Aestuariimicrobium sp. T2.26MG-19.2B]
MILTRFAKVAAIAAIGTLSLAACGGTTTTSTDSASSAASSAASTASSTETSASASQSAGGTELTCPAGKINGGGSSAQDIAMQALTKEYNSLCSANGSEVIYTKSGSGQGIKDFYNKQLQWAGSDSALKTEPKDGVVETEKVKARCGGNEGWNLPMIVGPVAFAYNLDGVDKLTVTPAIVADIYAGKITTWNDKALAAANPGVTLPAEKIAPFFRADESGTSENVTKYLKAAAPKNFTAETSKTFPAKVGEGKQGTQGVADAIKSTKGGFGYVEWKYAQDAQLGVSSVDNGSGAVELTAENAGKAMESAKIVGTGNDLALKLKYDGTPAGVYPMVMVTYEIVCSAGLDQAQGALMKDFLTYMTTPEAVTTLQSAGYAPLPEAVATKVSTAIQALK